MKGLDYKVGETVFYRENGAFVLAEVRRDNSFDGVKDEYLLKLTHVIVPGVGFEDHNIGDTWISSHALNGGGVSTGFMAKLDDTLTINSLASRGIDWSDLRKNFDLD